MKTLSNSLCPLRVRDMSDKHQSAEEPENLKVHVQPRLSSPTVVRVANTVSDNIPKFVSATKCHQEEKLIAKYSKTEPKTIKTNHPQRGCRASRMPSASDKGAIP